MSDSYLQARMMATHAAHTQQDVALVLTDVFELTQPTAEELRNLAVSKAKQGKCATGNTDSPAQFALTGSNRAADQAGQTSLF